MTIKDFDFLGDYIEGDTDVSTSVLDYRGLYSPTIVKCILCLFLQDLVNLNVTHTSDWLNHMV